MPPLQVSAATGGISAALVSAFLRAVDTPLPPLPPVSCQDLIPTYTELHWPSLVLGILLGLVLGQVLELLLTFRQYLVLTIRHRTWAFLNASAVKARLG